MAETDYITLLTVPTKMLKGLVPQAILLGDAKNLQEVEPSGKSLGHQKYTPKEDYGSPALLLLYQFSLAGNWGEQFAVKCSHYDPLS